MPYLPGYTFVDGIGQRLIDGAANVIQEMQEDATGLLDDIRSIIQQLAMSGVWAPLTIGEALAEALEKITGQIPANTTLADYVAAIYDFTRPANNVSSNIPYTLSTNQTAALAAIMAVRTDAASPHAATVQDVLDALGDPIVLPPTPPSGYGGGPTVDQIWGHVLNDIPGGPATADQGVAAAWRLANFLAQYAGTPVVWSPHFTVNYQTASGAAYPEEFQGVFPDYDDIRVTDTVLSWLTRTATPERVWEVASPTNLVVSYTNLGNEYHNAIVCTLTQAELMQLGGFGSGGELAATNTPPIWPGLDLVTLGTPVALSSSLTITGPLDGILVAVTTPPTKLSETVVGGISYWYRVGEITFISDNGQAEPFQYLGFANAIYTPRFMKQAASAKLRVLGGAEGTATPWTIAV